MQADGPDAFFQVEPPQNREHGGHEGFAHDERGPPPVVEKGRFHATQREQRGERQTRGTATDDSDRLHAFLHRLILPLAVRVRWSTNANATGTL